MRYSIYYDSKSFIVHSTDVKVSVESGCIEVEQEKTFNKLTNYAFSTHF